MQFSFSRRLPASRIVGVVVVVVGIVLVAIVATAELEARLVVVVVVVVAAAAAADSVRLAIPPSLSLSASSPPFPSCTPPLLSEISSVHRLSRYLPSSRYTSYEFRSEAFLRSTRVLNRRELSRTPPLATPRASLPVSQLLPIERTLEFELILTARRLHLTENPRMNICCTQILVVVVVAAAAAPPRSISRPRSRRPARRLAVPKPTRANDDFDDENEYDYYYYDDDDDVERVGPF